MQMQINLSLDGETLHGEIRCNGTQAVEVVSNVAFINKIESVSGSELVAKLGEINAALTRIAGEVGYAST